MGLRCRRATETEVEEIHGQLGQLGHQGLDHHGGDRGIQPDGWIVQHHLQHIGADLLGLVEMIGERLQIGDEHVGRVLALEEDALLQRADVVTQVQRAGGPVPGENRSRHGLPP